MTQLAFRVCANDKEQAVGLMMTQSLVSYYACRRVLPVSFHLDPCQERVVKIMVCLVVNARTWARE